MSKQPPDKITLAMMPNPGDENNKPDDHEEELRQKMILAYLKLEAKKAGLSVDGEAGELDPAAKPNEQRAESIKKTTQPKLVEATVNYSKTQVKETTIKADGTVRIREELRERATAKLGANVSELAELAKQVIDLAADIKGHVIGFLGKVGRFGIELITKLTIRKAVEQLPDEAFDGNTELVMEFEDETDPPIERSR